MSALPAVAPSSTTSSGCTAASSAPSQGAHACTSRLPGVCVDPPLALGPEREVLDGVRHVDVGPVDARLVERRHQLAPGRPDERHALQVLDVAGLLADQHQPRASPARARRRSASPAPTAGSRGSRRRRRAGRRGRRARQVGVGRQEGGGCRPVGVASGHAAALPRCGSRSDAARLPWQVAPCDPPRPARRRARRRPRDGRPPRPGAGAGRAGRRPDRRAVDLRAPHARAAARHERHPHAARPGRDPSAAGRRRAGRAGRRDRRRPERHRARPHASRRPSRSRPTAPPPGRARSSSPPAAAPRTWSPSPSARTAAWSCATSAGRCA